MNDGPVVPRARRRTDVYPAVDFRGHLAAIRLRRYSITLGATVVALVVLVLRLLTPPTFAADAIVRVDVQSAGGTQPADAATFAVQTVVGLAGTPAVRDAAATGSRLGIDSATVAARTSVSESTSPGFLTVRATGPTRQEAVALADATVTALAARLAEDRNATVEAANAPLRARLADLDAERTRVDANTPQRAAIDQQATALLTAITGVETSPAPVLTAAPAVPGPIPVSPAPRRDAAMAFLVALIVIAEGVVLVRALRGRLSEAEPSRQVTATLGLPAAEADNGTDPATALAPLYRAHLRSTDPTGGPLVTVQLGAPRARDLARDLAAAAVLTGDLVELRDPDTPARTGVRPMLRLRGARMDAELVRCVRDAAGPVVLAVDTVSTGRRQLERAFLTLDAVGVQVLAVVLWRGRPPRERRRARSTTGAHAAASRRDVLHTTDPAASPELFETPVNRSGAR